MIAMGKTKNKFKFLISIISFTLQFKNLTCDENQEVIKKGPFVMPDWVIPSFNEFIVDNYLDVIIYEKEISATMMSSRGWRSVINWSFLAKYDSETSGYVIRPNAREAEEWAEKNQCKVGKTYETSGDDDCWKDLGSSRENWIDARVLKMEPPGRRGFRSKCSTYWSCDIRKVTFPVYVTDNGDPYFSGPMGERIRIIGDGSSKVIPVKDSVLLFRTVKRVVEISKLKSRCQLNIDVETQIVKKVICTTDVGEDQIINIFTEKKKKSNFNNMLFVLNRIQTLYYSLMKTTLFGALRSPLDDSSSATIGDLKQLEKRLLLTSGNLVFEYHNIIKELAEVKHALKEVIMSAAKIDDTLIGRIVKSPVRTTWLNKDVFLLGSTSEDLLYEDSSKKNTNCEGSYVYEDGRWRLPDVVTRCLNWTDVKVLDILNNHMFDPLDLREAPEYRQSHNEYTGWSFLDTGKASLDWLDPNLKYKPKGGGLDDIFGEFNFLKIFGSINTIIVIGIVIFLVVTCCKR